MQTRQLTNHAHPADADKQYPEPDRRYSGSIGLDLVTFITMSDIEKTQQEDFSDGADDPLRTDSKSNWVLVMVLRTLSLAAAYGLLVLSRWIYTNELVDHSISLFSFFLMVVAVLGGVIFLYLGTIAPKKTVITVWKAVGAAILFLLG